MTSLDQDRAALRRLVDEYALAMDNADLEAFHKLFVPDGALIVRRQGRKEPMGTFTGPGTDGVALIALLMNEHYWATMHNVTTHVSKVDGDSATGTTLCLAYHVIERDDNGTPALETLAVRYEESFVRTAEGWRFRTRDVVRLWSQVTPTPYEPLVVDRAAGATSGRR
ncbi:MAG TPA: nuclear transport factor 2 family protein [Conexibacter sp.]